MTESAERGHLSDGTRISDEMIHRWSAEAEAGYDLDEIRRRRPGRPSLGTAPATVESVHLDPELKRELLLRAARDGVSVSELIRSALRSYVRAG